MTESNNKKNHIINQNYHQLFDTDNNCHNPYYNQSYVNNQGSNQNFDQNNSPVHNPDQIRNEHADQDLVYNQDRKGSENATEKCYDYYNQNQVHTFNQSQNQEHNLGQDHRPTMPSHQSNYLDQLSFFSFKNNHSENIHNPKTFCNSTSNHENADTNHEDDFYSSKLFPFNHQLSTQAQYYQHQHQPEHQQSNSFQYPLNQYYQQQYLQQVFPQNQNQNYYNRHQNQHFNNDGHQRQYSSSTQHEFSKVTKLQNGLPNSSTLKPLLRSISINNTNNPTLISGQQQRQQHQQQLNANYSDHNINQSPFMKSTDLNNQYEHSNSMKSTSSTTSPTILKNENELLSFNNPHQSNFLLSSNSSVNNLNIINNTVSYNLKTSPTFDLNSFSNFDNYQLSNLNQFSKDFSFNMATNDILNLHNVKDNEQVRNENYTDNSVKNNGYTSTDSQDVNNVVDNNDYSSGDNNIHNINCTDNDELPKKFSYTSSSKSSDVSICTPEMFSSSNYDFHEISTMNDPFGENMNDENYNNNGLSESILKIKTDIEINANTLDLKSIVEKLNSTQLQKFFDIKYKNFLALLKNENEIEDEISCLVLSENESIRNKKLSIFNDWETIKSTIEFSYCNCKTYICFSKEHTECPYINEPINADKEDAQNTSADKLEYISNHQRLPFSIVLFNNFVLSILLNKKLRTYLKKTIRPPKNYKEKSKYLNLVHDGSIYRDSIIDNKKLDFAFTFTLVTPSRLNVGTKNKNLGYVYFILNELPNHLKYRPEFMFLACVCDIDDKQEWNQYLLKPLLQYLNYLQDNVIRVSLNRHEYFVKILLIMALGNYQQEKADILDMHTSSSKYRCIYCTVPRSFVKNDKGDEFKPIYNSRRYPNVTMNDYLNLKKKGLLIANDPVDHWSLRKIFILEELPYFDINRSLVFDIQKYVLEGVFENGITRLIKNHFKIVASDYAFRIFNSSLSKIQTDIVEHNVFDNATCILQLGGNKSSTPEELKFGSSASDLKILQSIFPYLFHIYYDNMFEDDKSIKHGIIAKFKVLSLLLELNAYVGALFCSEVERIKVPLLRNGFYDLIREIEHLSKFTPFKNFNLLLTLPLHYMYHVFDKWEDIGDLNSLSTWEMSNGINQLEELIKKNKNHTATSSVMSEYIKCLNISNCMKIYNFKVTRYPLFKFLNYSLLDKSKLSIKSSNKVKEFSKRFLIDDVNDDIFNEFSTLRKIDVFELNSLTIKPEEKSTALNLVRIKNSKRSLEWKYVHIYGAVEVEFRNPFTKETSRGVFIEYKETKTHKRFQKTSIHRPAFSLGEFLTLKAPSKEIRCIWLDDVQMVALRVLNESHWIYDPLMSLERAFDI